MNVMKIEGYKFKQDFEESKITIEHPDGQVVVTATFNYKQKTKSLSSQQDM